MNKCFILIGFLTYIPLLTYSQISREICDFYNSDGTVIISEIKIENIFNADGKITRQIITNYTRDVFAGTITSSTKEENINNAAGQITRQIITNYTGSIFDGLVINSTKEENIYSPEGYLTRRIFTTRDA